MELVVDKDMSFTDLRDRIAVVSGIEPQQIALASAKTLRQGEKRKALTGTVADMEKVLWLEWDPVTGVLPHPEVRKDVLSRLIIILAQAMSPQYRSICVVHCCFRIQNKKFLSPK